PVDDVSMSPEGEGFLASLGVPHLYRLVLASASQVLTVGAEHHTMNPVGVALKGEGFLPGLGIPYPHGLILAGAGEAVAIGAETDAVDALGVPLEGEGFLSSLRVPKLHFAGLERLPTTACYTLAVGAKAHAFDLVFVTSDCHQVAVCAVPQVMPLEAAQI